MIKGFSVRHNRCRTKGIYRLFDMQNLQCDSPREVHPSIEKGVVFISFSLELVFRYGTKRKVRLRREGGFVSQTLLSGSRSRSRHLDMTRQVRSRGGHHIESNDCEAVHSSILFSPQRISNQVEEVGRLPRSMFRSMVADSSVCMICYS